MLGEKKLKVAIIDLYNNEPNQGMRCIQDILNETDVKFQNVNVEYDIFETRYKSEIPDLDYDVFISSGGPGSPYDGEGAKWESDYFKLLDKIVAHNSNGNDKKKHIIFICHSFQIMIRYFKIAEVIKRKSTSFGIMPVNKTEDGMKDSVLRDLPEPFYGADFRDWQVVQPNRERIEELGAKILCIEKERPHVPLERAIMAVRISDEILGTQFHPEADPASMYYHFRQPERKAQVVSKHGEEKYFEMLKLLEDPNAIIKTHSVVLPSFLRDAIHSIYPEEKPISV